MSDDLTPADENLEPLFALSDIADPAVFLAGAVIPLAPRPALSMPPTNAYFWCRDHLIISDSEEGAAMRINSDDVDIFDVLMVDLSDPDVARWVDLKFAEVLSLRSARPWKADAAVLGVDYLVVIVGGAMRAWSVYGIDHHAARMGRTTVAGVRLALLHTLFGSANV